MLPQTMARNLQQGKNHLRIVYPTFNGTADYILTTMLLGDGNGDINICHIPVRMSLNHFSSKQGTRRRNYC